MVIKFRWNRSTSTIIGDRIVNDRNLLFMANTWHRLYDQFTPMDTGNLAHDSIDVYTDGKRGYIHHKAPYARKIYHGTGMNFKKTKHHLASALWDRAAISAGQREVLARDMEAYINRGGGS